MNWTGNTNIGQSSGPRPSLAVFNGQLYVALVADNGSNSVLVCSSSDGVNWLGNTNIGQFSPLASSLVAAPFDAFFRSNSGVFGGQEISLPDP